MVQGLIYRTGIPNNSLEVFKTDLHLGLKPGAGNFSKREKIDLILLIQKRNASKTLKFWLWQNLIARKFRK
jgi:hypothetical protein